MIYTKTDKELEFYIKYSPIFKNILKILRKSIRLGKLKNSTEIEDKFKELCNERFKDIIESYVFEDIENTFQQSFGHAVCVSINNCIAHGWTKSNFNKNDIIKIDAGISLYSDNKKNSLKFDSAFTEVFNSDLIYPYMREIYINENVLDKIYLELQTKDNIYTNQISEIIQNTAINNNLDLIVKLTGHGIGHNLHEKPIIHNALGQYINQKLLNNTVFCIEPMYVIKEKNIDNYNISKIYIDSDGWSIKTENNNIGFHFESMFCIYKNKLTRLT